MKRILTFGVLTGLCACGSAKEPPAGSRTSGEVCPPRKVVLDGVEVPGLIHGYAVTESYRGQRVDRVTLLNHEEPCANLVSKVWRPPAEGEVSVHAKASTAALARGLTMGSTNTFGIDVRMLTPPPRAIGDTVTLCVPETTFTLAAKERGIPAVVGGTFTGTWCGETR